MRQKYALEKGEKRAMAAGLSLPISVKHSVEVCSFIRNKDVDKALKLLNVVVEGKIAIPYRRYNRDLSHKSTAPGPGRYPKKTCSEIIKLLKSVKSNAEDLGLGENLVIRHISASKASTPWHYGRFRRRKAKRTNVKVIVEEIEEKQKERAIK